MKNYILLTLAALSLSACGIVPNDDHQGIQIQTQFQPYVNAFIAKAAQEGHPVSIQDLTIRIDDTMQGPTGGTWTLGICTSGGGSQPTITVNPYFWNNSYYGNADREELLFHEMGHCVLGRGHTSATVVSMDGYSLAASIMNPYHLGSYKYGVNYNYYMQELFGAPNNPNSLLAYGATQFTNVYASVMGSNSAPQIKMYAVTAKATGEMNHDEDGDEVPPSIEGMACGDESN